MIQSKTCLRSLGAALLMLGGAASAASAQNTPAGTNGQQGGQGATTAQGMQGGAQGTPTAASIRQGIQSSLQQAGYTNIDIAPSSFYVHAKDKQGHPVSMVIGPDTVTEVTELPMAQAPSGGTGSGSKGNAAGTP